MAGELDEREPLENLPLGGAALSALRSRPALRGLQPPFGSSRESSREWQNGDLRADRAVLLNRFTTISYGRPIGDPSRALSTRRGPLSGHLYQLLHTALK